MNREQVDRLLTERIEQLNDGKVVGDFKNRSLSLKLRANPSQLGSSSRRGGIEEKDLVQEEMENLKVEMLRELRDIKQAIKESMGGVASANSDLVRELKTISQSLSKIPEKIQKVS